MDVHTQFDIKATEEQAFIKKLTAKLNAKQTSSYKYITAAYDAVPLHCRMLKSLPTFRESFFASTL